MENQEPAFPEKRQNSAGIDYDIPGMTLRDYFAAKAMQTILEYRLNKGMHNVKGAYDSYISPEAYSIADSMLTEREKPCQTQP